MVSIACVAAAQRDLSDIPKPDPVREQMAMRPFDGAAVNLFAANPAISKPVQFNFDADGSLWIASSKTYPQIQPGQGAQDEIIVLRDSDGDGVHDQRTVFADGLLIPTGVIPDGTGGAYVADSTRLLHLTDNNNDGVADRRQTLLSGFGTEDTHHLLHTLRFGPDGCLYFNQSIYIHSHVETPYGIRRLDGGGIWRYDPKTGQLNVLCKGFVNPWGHVFDDHGESFVTDGAFFEGINYVFPDAVFVTSPGASRWLAGMNPGSPKHCGLGILSGTHIPESWNGQFITSDFRGHRVCRFDVRAGQGSGYISRQKPEVLTSSDVAFRPIGARMGPDGAIYVADWANPIIQHGEVDFRDPRRDRVSGRIWRISFPERKPDPWPALGRPRDTLTDAEIDQRIDLLSDPAAAVRQFARQSLWPMARADHARLDQRFASKTRTLSGNTNSSQQKRMHLERLWLAGVADRWTRFRGNRDAAGWIDNAVRNSCMAIAKDPTTPAMRPMLRFAVRHEESLGDDALGKIDEFIFAGRRGFQQPFHGPRAF
ncbi:MAG: PVC-type heme-binding CxxCH protein, partial [Planctomycetota bacterium]